LLEAVSTEHSAMGAARALAGLMRHLYALGQRIAVELPDHDRDAKPAGQWRIDQQPRTGRRRGQGNQPC
jgi:hypothetical protein